MILSKNLTSKRMEIIKLLNKNNIGTSIYYPQPVPRMSFYKKNMDMIKECLKMHLK